MEKTIKLNKCQTERINKAVENYKGGLKVNDYNLQLTKTKTKDELKKYLIRLELSKLGFAYNKKISD